MLTSNLTQKGQVTLPAKIRKALNIKTGDKISFSLEDNRIIAIPVSDNISSIFGSIKSDKSVSIKEMDRFIAEAASE